MNSDRRGFLGFSVGMGSLLLGRPFDEGIAGIRDGEPPVLARANGTGPEAVDGPVVFWASDPVGPDQTLMLFGDGLRKGQVRAMRFPDAEPGLPLASPSPRGGGERLPLLQGDGECLKVSIPESWEPGLYGVWVETPSGVGRPQVLNRAEGWWVLGERGTTARPYGEARVFGKNFRLDSQDGPWSGRVVLRDGKGKFHPVEVSAVNKYALTLRIPEDMPEGEASVFVHNGWGGGAGWSAPLTLDIKQLDRWPQTVFNVRDFGALGDALQDDTAAFQAALRKCEEQRRRRGFSSPGYLPDHQSTDVAPQDDPSWGAPGSRMDTRSQGGAPVQHRAGWEWGIWRRGFIDGGPNPLADDYRSRRGIHV